MENQCRFGLVISAGLVTSRSGKSYPSDNKDVNFTLPFVYWTELQTNQECFEVELPKQSNEWIS